MAAWSRLPHICAFHSPQRHPAARVMVHATIPDGAGFLEHRLVQGPQPPQPHPRGELVPVAEWLGGMALGKPHIHLCRSDGCTVQFRCAATADCRLGCLWVGGGGKGRPINGRAPRAACSVNEAAPMPWLRPQDVDRHGCSGVGGARRGGATADASASCSQLRTPSFGWTRPQASGTCFSRQRATQTCKVLGCFWRGLLLGRGPTKFPAACSLGRAGRRACTPSPGTDRCAALP